MTLQHLVVPTRETRSIDLLSDVCFWSGIQVLRVEPGTEGRLPDGWTLADTAVHGGPRFCREIARTLGAAVAEPDDGFLAALPREYAGRTLRLMRLRQARALSGPVFIKPVNDKHFRAAVYDSGAGLAADGRFDGENVLVADPVTWESEYRLFVLDSEVRAASFYAPAGGDAAAEGGEREARAFGARVLADGRVSLPRAVVLDVGRIRGAGWAVVEANAAVMSSLYDCDPAAVLDVLHRGLLHGGPTPRRPAP